jgi:hypothetical protein
MAVDGRRARGATVREPREALEAARRAAAAAGAESDPASWTLEDPARSTRRLVEWAIIEPAEANVYSTRRFGRPITVFKRLLVRMLRQYLNEISAQQSRFNALVAAHVMRLEERVDALERERGHGREQQPAAPDADPPPR